MTDELYKTIELRKPIEANGKKVEQLELRPPRVGEKRIAESALTNGLNPANITRLHISLLAKVAGVSEAIIEQMDVDQFTEATSFLESFSNPGRTTGNG